MLDFLSGEHRDAAECVVRVGQAGEELEGLYPHLSELTVEASRSEATVATLGFRSRRDESGKWLVQDEGGLEPWAPIRIEAAFGQTTEEIMRGFIREIEADYPENAGEATVRVRCQDESLALDREHRRVVWGQETPTDDRTVLTEILGRHGLSLASDSADGLSGLVLNQNSTDVRFLQQRAEANGYELIFRQGELYFGPMRLDAEPQKTMLVYAARDSHCYRLSIKDDGHSPDRVAFDAAAETGAESVSQVVGPDQPLLGQEAAESSGSGLGEFAWRLDRPGTASPEELQARAQGKANELAMKVVAEGELDGSFYGHVLQVGLPVGVDGIGERYNGIYYVDRVTHRFSFSGYRQSFRLLRNAYGDNLSSAESLLAGLL